MDVLCSDLAVVLSGKVTWVLQVRSASDSALSLAVGLALPAVYSFLLIPGRVESVFFCSTFSQELCPPKQFKDFVLREIWGREMGNPGRVSYNKCYHPYPDSWPDLCHQIFGEELINGCEFPLVFAAPTSSRSSQ